MTTDKTTDKGIWNRIMTMMDFETLAEYFDDRYTPAEVVDMFDIPMVDLIDCIYDYLQEYRSEQLEELITEEQLTLEDDNLELSF